MTLSSCPLSSLYYAAAASSYLIMPTMEALYLASSPSSPLSLSHPTQYASSSFPRSLTCPYPRSGKGQVRLDQVRGAISFLICIPLFLLFVPLICFLFQCSLLFSLKFSELSFSHHTMLLFLALFFFIYLLLLLQRFLLFLPSSSFSTACSLFFFPPSSQFSHPLSSILHILLLFLILLTLLHSAPPSLSPLPLLSVVLKL